MANKYGARRVEEGLMQSVSTLTNQTLVREIATIKLYAAQVSPVLPRRYADRIGKLLVECKRRRLAMGRTRRGLGVG